MYIAYIVYPEHIASARNTFEQYLSALRSAVGALASSDHLDETSKHKQRKLENSELPTARTSAKLAFQRPGVKIGLSCYLSVQHTTKSAPKPLQRYLVSRGPDSHMRQQTSGEITLLSLITQLSSCMPPATL